MREVRWSQWRGAATTPIAGCDAFCRSSRSRLPQPHSQRLGTPACRGEEGHLPLPAAAGWTALSLCIKGARRVGPQRAAGLARPAVTPHARPSGPLPRGVAWFLGSGRRVWCRPRPLLSPRGPSPPASSSSMIACQHLRRARGGGGHRVPGVVWRGVAASRSCSVAAASATNARLRCLVALAAVRCMILTCSRGLSLARGPTSVYSLHRTRARAVINPPPARRSGAQAATDRAARLQDPGPMNSAAATTRGKQRADRCQTHPMVAPPAPKLSRRDAAPRAKIIPTDCPPAGRAVRKAWTCARTSPPFSAARAPPTRPG